MLRTLLAPFFSLLFISGAFAQKIKTDSLKKVIREGQADTSRVHTLNLLAYELRNSQPDTALILADQALALAQTLEFNRGLAEAHLAKAVAQSNLGKPTEALASLTEALAYPADNRVITKTLNNRGLVYNNMGNYPLALKDYYRALKLAERERDSAAMSSAYNNLGNIYRKQKNFREALRCFHISLQLKKQLHDRKGLAIVYNNRGLVFDEMGNYTDAIRDHEASRGIRVEMQDRLGVAASYNNIGNIVFHLKDYPKAFENYMQAYAIRKELRDKSGLATSAINIGSVCIKQGKTAEARKWLEEALRYATEIKSLYFLQETYHNLTELDSVNRDAKSGLMHYKLFIAYRDSLFNEENTKKTVQAQMQYEFDKKEAATRLEQEKKDAVAGAEKRRQQIVLAAASGFGLLVLAFAVFAWRSLVQKRRANVEITRQKELIEQKQKEILDSIHYARRIQNCLLPNEKYISKRLNVRHDAP